VAKVSSKPISSSSQGECTSSYCCIPIVHREQSVEHTIEGVLYETTGWWR